MSVPIVIEIDDTVNEDSVQLVPVAEGPSIEPVIAHGPEHVEQREIVAHEEQENVPQQDVPLPVQPPSQENPEIIQPPDPLGYESPHSSSPPKKRKRISAEHTPKLKVAPGEDDNEDDGLTCPICMDSWEMSGEHRLVALKCGHLFGDSCIRRWLVESARNGLRCCPQCKSRAVNRDIRNLYARRIRALDRTEEHRLREQLEGEKTKVTRIQTQLATLRMSYTAILQENNKLSADNERLKNTLRVGGRDLESDSNSPAEDLSRLRNYNLSMLDSIQISKEPGCRVMIYSQLYSRMMVSQKAPQNIFLGYGLRFIDAPTFRPTTFLHTSTKTVRDICLSADQTLLVAASMESKVKLFDTRSRVIVSRFTPTDKPLWACSFGRNKRENTLYIGAQHGSTHSYDIRFPETVVEEFKTEFDLSPVINIAPVPVTNHFPQGGFLVCKLQSMWFYEYTDDVQQVTATRMGIDGPFISMSYDAANENLLVFARNSTRYPQSRYILGKLEKLNDVPVLNVRVSFFGSTVTPVMTRCSQIAVENNTLIAAYVQDSKVLTLFDIKREKRLQSLPVRDVVYDTCAVYVPDSTFLAALTETKCSIYKILPIDR